MVQHKIIYAALTFWFSIQSAFPAAAQMFATDDNAPTASDQVKTPASGSSGWGRFYNQQAKSANQTEPAKKTETETSVATKPPAKQDVVNPEDYIYKNVPQIDRPTLDGVERGRTSVVPVVRDGKVQAEGYIYIFYSDFSVGSMMSGSTTCDVKFQILTTLDRKLNSLALRLKWPKMDTPLTFIDVNPNQQYHFTYTLLGDGCYSMDKIPNMVINRCRVKGMTQEECARRVRWMRKK